MAFINYISQGRLQAWLDPGALIMASSLFLSLHVLIPCVFCCFHSGCQLSPHRVEVASANPALASSQVSSPRWEEGDFLVTLGMSPRGGSMSIAEPTTAAGG